MRAGNRTAGLAGAALALLVLTVVASARAVERRGGGLPPIDTTNADRCDFPAQARCLFPFPNDSSTVADRGSPTGRRVHLQTASMPTDKDGKPIEASDYNWSDGFSAGAPIVTKVPGLDTPKALRRTGAVPVTNIGAYLRPDAPIVVIDAKTGKRWPIFAEVDVNPPAPANRALIIRPAVNFAAKHRYVVALRTLRRADGSRIPAPATFRYYRDRVASSQPEVNARRAHFERKVFKPLERAGVG